MAHFKTLFILSLLFAVVLLISSKASAGNEPAGVAQTQVDAEVDDWRGGGGGWRGGWGGWRGGGGGWRGGGGWGGGWGGRGGWGGWRGGGGGWRGCRYPYCTNVAGGDAQTEAESGDGDIP